MNRNLGAVGCHLRLELLGTLPAAAVPGCDGCAVLRQHFRDGRADAACPTRYQSNSTFKHELYLRPPNSLKRPVVMPSRREARARRASWRSPLIMHHED